MSFEIIRQEGEPLSLGKSPGELLGVPESRGCATPEDLLLGLLGEGEGGEGDVDEVHGGQEDVEVGVRLMRNWMEGWVRRWERTEEQEEERTREVEKRGMRGC